MSTLNNRGETKQHHSIHLQTSTVLETKTLEIYSNPATLPPCQIPTYPLVEQGKTLIINIIITPTLVLPLISLIKTTFEICLTSLKCLAPGLSIPKNMFS